MIVAARSKPSASPQVSGSYLYWWLLLVVFVEYGRPGSYITLVDLSWIYAVLPISLLLVSSIAKGLRPVQSVFSDRLSKWVFILLAIILLSAIAAPSWNIAFPPFQGVLGYVILFLLLTRIATTLARIRGVFVALLVAHVFLLAMNPDAVLNPQNRNYIKGATFLGDGNDFALSLCILLPLTIELAQHARSIWPRLSAWCGVVLIVLAIIASQSRGGTLGLAAVVAYEWWKSQRKAPALLAAALVGVAVLAYAPPAYFQRMGTIANYHASGSAMGRINAWKGAIGMGAKNPLLGIGPRHFSTRWGKTAHSTYMLAFAELGIPGFVCVLMLVFGNVRANLKAQRQIQTGQEPGLRGDVSESVRMLSAMIAAMLAFGVAGAFLSAVYYPHMYVLTALMVAVRHVTAFDVRAGADRPSRREPNIIAKGRAVRPVGRRAARP